MQMKFLVHEPNDEGILVVTTLYRSKGSDFWHTWLSAFKMIMTALRLAITGQAGSSATIRHDDLHCVPEFDKFMEEFDKWDNNQND